MKLTQETEKNYCPGFGNYTVRSVKLIPKFLCLFLLCLLFNKVTEGQVFNFTGSNKLSSLSNNIEFYIDSSGKILPNEITQKAPFIKNTKATPSFGLSKNHIWIRFSICNKTNSQDVSLIIPEASISTIQLFKDSANQLKEFAKAGSAVHVSNQTFRNPDYVFNLHIKPAETETYYLQVSSYHPISLPISVGKFSSVENVLNIKSSIISLYVGIILTIFFYNLFLFISTLDRTYFYYILYIFLLGLAQVTLSGYSSIYFWNNLPALNQYAVPVTTCIAGMAASLFTINFLRTKIYAPFFHTTFLIIIVLFASAMIISLIGNNKLSYSIFAITTLTAPVISIIASLKIARQGYRPAYFYFVSFLAFSIGLIVFTLKNENLVPNNNFTSYILYVGTAIATILLSFALADKINILSKEKEESQAYSLKVARENEKLIGEQNIVLEQKVAERTNELQRSNVQLNKTLGELKDAQTQLVEAEKMASLGQLTAGIAHEINNPINFVKSNIKPLQLDIDDLFSIIDQYNLLHGAEKENISKQLENVYHTQKALDMDYVKDEIKQLIKGIEDGAERTAEIVRGLRTFSRLDESELKVANVHDGIDSTIVLVRNSMQSNIRIEKKFTAKGIIECYPGKLNQVFLNILNNSIQAIAAKKDLKEDDLISIFTADVAGNCLQIKIKDSGIGMNEDVIHRIFEPFFTTKPVGEGTGLGMAIVFKIIEEHHGKIDVSSQLGKGSEFVITLPYIHSSDN